MWQMHALMALDIARDRDREAAKHARWQRQLHEATGPGFAAARGPLRRLLEDVGAAILRPAPGGPAHDLSVDSLASDAARR